MAVRLRFEQWCAGAQGRSTAAFPQPRSLSAALLEMQLLVLGPLTAAVSETNQLQILGVGPPPACQTRLVFLAVLSRRCSLSACAHRCSARCAKPLMMLLPVAPPQVMKSAVAAEGSRDQAAVIAVCCAAIAGLSALAGQHRSGALAEAAHNWLCVVAARAVCSKVANVCHASPYGCPSLYHRP